MSPRHRLRNAGFTRVLAGTCHFHGLTIFVHACPCISTRTFAVQREYLSLHVNNAYVIKLVESCRGDYKMSECTFVVSNIAYEESSM